MQWVFLSWAIKQISTLPRKQRNSLQSPSDGSIEVRQAIFGGNSGGPLMDSSGSSIGTCRESIGIGATVARYVSMSDAETLLDLIPMTDRMIHLDKARLQVLSLKWHCGMN